MSTRITLVRPATAAMETSALTSIVRLVLSHVVLPSAPARRTAATLAGTLVRLLR